GKARLHGNRRTRSSRLTRQRPAQTPPAVTGRGSLPRARLRSSFLSADDPGLRSIHHYLPARVPGHALICMLAYRYRDLLEHLSTLDRQTINFAGQRIEKLANPTPVQRQAFELLGAPVPLTIQ